MTRCPDSLTACNTLSSSAPPQQTRCAENTDGSHFLHLNAPSVNIDCACPHTAYTFSVTNLKNIDSSSFKPQSEVGFDSSCFKPQSVVAPQTVQSPTCDNQHHRIFSFRPMPRMCWPHILHQTGNQLISSDYVVVNKILICAILQDHVSSQGADALANGGHHLQEIVQQVYPSCLLLQHLLHLQQHFYLHCQHFIVDDPLKWCVSTVLQQHHQLQFRQRCLHQEQSGIEPDLTFSNIFLFYFI